MEAWGDQIARLRVASETGSLPKDLGRWLLTTLAEAAPDAVRTEARNGLLRAAGDLVGGSRWARAKRLEREIARLTSRRPPEDLDAVGSLVAQALELDPSTPRGWRQLLRVLA